MLKKITARVLVSVEKVTLLVYKMLVYLSNKQDQLEKMSAAAVLNLPHGLLIQRKNEFVITIPDLESASRWQLFGNLVPTFSNLTYSVPQLQIFSDGPFFPTDLGR